LSLGELVLRNRGRRFERGLEEDRRSTVRDVGLKRDNSTFRGDEGWSCDYGGWLGDYDTVRTLIKVVTNVLYYSFRINTILYYCKLGFTN
jgi:hypothetical protein